MKFPSPPFLAVHASTICIAAVLLGLGDPVRAQIAIAASPDGFDPNTGTITDAR